MLYILSALLLRNVDALLHEEPSKGDGATGDADATAAGDSSGTTTPEDLGYMGDDVRMREICAAVAGL